MVRKSIPLCPTCGQYLGRIKLVIVDGKCWKCKSTMKVAMKEKGNTSGPNEFTIEELDLARKEGVLIKIQHSKMAGEQYLANTCKCGAFVGNHYLFTDYLNPAQLGDFPSKTFDLGNICGCPDLPST